MTSHIGILGPATLEMLADELDAQQHPLPSGYPFPQTSLIVKELLQLGHRVSLFTLSKGIEAPMTVHGARLTVHIGRYRSAHRARDFFEQEVLDLVGLMRRDPCEVYGAHWLYEFALAGLRYGGPLAVTVHDWPLQVLRHQPTPYRAARLAMAMKVLGQFRGELIAVSPYIARTLRWWTGRSASVIPNGIEATAFPSTVLNRASRRSALVSIANGFGRRKNTSTLIRAFARLRTAVAGVELHLIGDDHDAKGAAAAWAISHNLADGIRFLGPLPYAETQEHVGRAIALVHPSLEESFGRTLIEAMAKGTPVIGGKRSGAVPWVLDSGAAGLLVDVMSDADLERGMQQLIEDTLLWNALSEQGQVRASSHYSLEATTRSYAETLETVRVSA